MLNLCRLLVVLADACHPTADWLSCCRVRQLDDACTPIRLLPLYWPH
jgi:hypothetical protein